MELSLLFGSLLVTIPVIVTATQVIRGQPLKAQEVILFGIFILSGVSLFLIDRATEISVTGVGTIKAAAKMADDDAKQIIQLKEEMEEKNDKALELLSDLEKALHDANLQMKALQSREEFSKIVLASQFDDRQSFDRLFQLATDEEYVFQEEANEYYDIIARANSSGVFIAPELKYLNNEGENIDLDRFSLSDFAVGFYNLDRDVRSSVLFHIRDRDDLSLKAKSEFLIDVIRNDVSIQVTANAIRAFNRLVRAHSHIDENELNAFSVKLHALNVENISSVTQPGFLHEFIENWKSIKIEHVIKQTN